MRLGSIHFILASGIAAFLGLVADAQPSAGHYIVVGRPNTFRLPFPQIASVDGGGAITTLVSATPGRVWLEPTMDFDNRHLVAWSYPTRAGVSLMPLLRVAPDGTAFTIAAPLTVARPQAVVLDDDGSYLTLGDDDVVYRIANGRGNIVASLAGLGANGLEVDPVTGDYWIVGAKGEIRIVDRAGAVTSIMLPTIGLDLADIDYDAGADAFTVASEIQGTVYRVDRGGRVLSTVKTPIGTGPSAIRNEPDRAVVHISHLTLLQQAYATMQAHDGTVLRTTPMPFWSDRYSFEVYGSRPVSGFGSAKPGSTYQLLFGFPGATRLQYVAVLSLAGVQPAIVLADGRRIGIAPDGLFFQTALGGDIPGITQGLRGRLNIQGIAFARLSLPASLPRGLRIFATAVALDSAAPLGLRTANTWAFGVR